MLDHIDELREDAFLLESSVRDASTFYRRIVDETSDAILGINLKQTIVFFNRAAQQMFGYRWDEILGQPLSRLIPERFRAGHPGMVQEFQSSGDRARYMGDRRSHVTGLHADGSELALGASIARIEAGGEQYFIAIIRDISPRIGQLSEAMDLANTDSLTGAPNRRYFFDIAELAHQMSCRFNTSFSILLVDIDHFKQINDTAGHDAGDRVLIDLCKLAESELRATDTFARLGGRSLWSFCPWSASRRRRRRPSVSAARSKAIASKSGGA